MKNFIRTFGIIALVAVIGFSMAACGDGGGSSNNNNDDNKDKNGGDGGGYDLSLYISSIHISGNNYEVEFEKSIGAIGAGDYLDFELTIDGEAGTISTVGSETLNGTTTYSVYFSMDSALTVGTKYAVVVKYTGSKVAPFTVEGTVPLQKSKYSS